MTTTLEQIQADLTAAMKARDDLKKSTLRMVLAALKDAAVAGDEAHVLSEDEAKAVLQREVKRRDEAATAFLEGGRDDRAAAEKAERDVIAAYLPAALSDEELTAIVTDELAKGGFTDPKDMGAAMKAITAAVDGRADGKTVSTLVRARLAS